MPKFRKKPVEIEAWQLPAQADASTDAVWMQIASWCGGRMVCDVLGYCILIDTLEGQMRADPEDWIIKGVKGEFYPIKSEIFAQTYEPVEA